MKHTCTIFLLLLFACLGTASAQPQFDEHVIEPHYDGANTIDVTDMDGDKDLDIVSSASGSEEISWWENQDSLNFEYHYVGAAQNPSRLEAGDLDGDGDKDIVCAFDFGNMILWYENQGNDTWLPHTLVSGYPEARSVELADMDSDGDVDVVSCGQWRVTWFENTGSALSFIAHDLDTNFPGAAMVQAFDVDLDGDKDVFCTAYWWDDTAWWENDGAEMFTRHDLNPTLDDPHWMEVADLNGDMLKDVIVSSRSTNELMVYRNTGSGFTGYSVACPVQGPQGITAADFDDDQDTDFIVVGRAEGSIWLFLNDNNEFEPFLIQNGRSLCSNVHAGPMDHDMDIDFVATYQGENTLAVWENHANDNIDPAEMIEIELVPFNPPIVIPPIGGWLTFSAVISNHSEAMVSGFAWAWVVTPTENIVPFAGPIGLTLGPGESVDYPYLQAHCPAGAPAGTYTMRAAIGEQVPYPLDMDEFPIVKLAASGHVDENAEWRLTGWDEPSGEVQAEPVALPDGFALSAYPNPFNPSTTVTVDLPASSELSVTVFDVQGRVVSTLADGWHQAGVHTIQFDAQHLAAGMYFVQARGADGETISRKLMLLK